MIPLMKQFLTAERMGDCESHLECIEVILPFFHVAGHLNYAKSARFCLQDRRSLKGKMNPLKYKKFTDDDFLLLVEGGIIYTQDNIEGIERYYVLESSKS